MDPISTALLQARATKSVVIAGELYWEGTYDTSITVSGLKPGSYTRSGNSNGCQTYSNTLPAIDAEGIYFDVALQGGFSTSPTEVAWLGVTNATSAFNFSSGESSYTGWYWNGSVTTPSGASTDTPIALDQDTYRIALRSVGGALQIAFFSYGRKRTRGPFASPASTGPNPLRLMMLGQGGFPLPIAQIVGDANSGRIFRGGGGIF